MPKKYRSEEDWKAAVEKRIRKPVNDYIWKELVESGFVDGVIEGDTGVKDLVSEYRKLERIYQKGLEIGAETYGARRLFLVRKEGKSSTSKTDIILSKLIAAEIGRLPIVKKFRREALKGRLVQPDKIEDWIQTVKEVEEQVYESRYVWSDFISFPARTGRIKQTLIPLEGTLGRLKDLANEIITRYCPGWQEAEAVGFILVGQAPLIPKVRYKSMRGVINGPCWITLKFDARMTPQDLAKEYAEIRCQLLGRHHVKPLTRKHQELAMFAAEYKDGLTWKKLMHKWNEKFPEWAYENYRLFHRDAIAAKDRVLDDKVDPARLLELFEPEVHKNNGQ